MKGAVTEANQTSVLARNNACVRNVRNVRIVRNMFGPRLFGTFGQHWPDFFHNESKSNQHNKSQHVALWGCQFLFGFRMVTSNDASGYVYKISMLRLNIGSGMLRLSSCILSIGLDPNANKARGGSPPPLALNGFGSSTNAEHA